jgi:hypothetical protein
MTARPYAEHIGRPVTVTRTAAPAVHGHMWRITPDLMRVITDTDDMVTIPLAEVARVEEMSVGIADQVRITDYHGTHHGTVITILPGMVTVRVADGRTGTVQVPPPPGMTLTVTRRATDEERAEFDSRRLTTRGAR